MHIYVHTCPLYIPVFIYARRHAHIHECRRCVCHENTITLNNAEYYIGHQFLSVRTAATRREPRVEPSVRRGLN